MPQVSRRIVPPKTRKKIDELFIEAITYCSNNDTPEFLTDLLTPTEKIMLAKRLAIAYLLLKGYPYEAITYMIKVSTPTVGSVSLRLKYGGNGLRKIIDKIAHKDKWRIFFEELGDMALEVIGMAPGSDWKTTRSILRERKMERQSPL